MNFKLIPFFVVIFIYSTTLFAQHDKSKSIAQSVHPLTSSKTPTDTLKPISFNTGTPTLYKYVEGGYDFGVNKLGDRAYAQVFKVSTSYIVDGIAFWVGAKNQVDALDTDTLDVVLYKLDGPGTDTSGPVNNAPDTAKMFWKIPVSKIDTSNLNFITFTKPIYAFVDYAVGTNFSEMGNDTIGLVSTTDGDAHGTQLVWNETSDGNWFTVLDSWGSWGMDVDLGIFMIVDTSSANVNDNYFVDGIKLSQNQPNPASGTTLIQYEIQNNSNVTLQIFDNSGKIIASLNQGNQSAGRHEININSENLNSGSYYYSLIAGNKRLTKKMIISK